MTCANASQQLPGNWSPEIYQGGTYTSTLTVTVDGVPFDFTGYSGVMVLVNASKDVILTVSTTNGYITSMSNVGVISFNIPVCVLKLIPPDTYQFDLLVTSGAGVVTPIVAGNAVVIYSPSAGSL
jgi:hypothetical protein